MPAPLRSRHSAASCSSIRRCPPRARWPARPATIRRTASGRQTIAPVQLGGSDMRQPGLRAVPSLTYLQDTPPFTEHYFESPDEGDDSIDNGPTGGLTWDGAIDRGREQARVPLLSPFEMANENPNAVVARARAAGYEPNYSGSTRRGQPADSNKAFAVILAALESFEQSWRDFYPYSSKYDAYLAGRAQFSPQEARGLALFNDPKKGNCAHCHKQRARQRRHAAAIHRLRDDRARRAAQSRHPRQCRTLHITISASAGRCAKISQVAPEYCGLFARRRCATSRCARPSSTTASCTRCAMPCASMSSATPGRSKWYPRTPDGSVAKFDDLPHQYWANLNNEPPFGGKPGDPPG